MPTSPSSLFSLAAPYRPSGDQPAAIEALIGAFERREKYQTLLGVTGSGKTFTMANTIQALGRPVLVITHNKTLVAQLYQEFKAYFPRNAVEYFVSYYDYYQPEAYIPSSDMYIEKDASINEEIEKLRLRTTASLMSRRDVIVVSSVSCIYGLGSPADYRDLMLVVRRGMRTDRDDILRKLVEIHYTRNDYEFKRGTFRVRGDVLEIRPAYDDFGIRVEMFGDEVEKIARIDLLKGEVTDSLDKIFIYPARHYITREETMDRVMKDIRAELDERLQWFKSRNKLLEAQRLETRTRYDLEMLAETGFCSGVENYSRIVENRPPGSPPHTLMDFMGSDFFLIIDESHATIPQIGGMYAGDRSRKENLVEYGFRLPCALDNRPLNFEEFENKMPKTLFVSATPADYEMEKCHGAIVEQIVRPTGLLEPEIEVRPIHGQIDNMLEEVRRRNLAGERTLIITLTKKSAEDLTDFLKQAGLKVLYIHSDTEALKRMEILQKLRQGNIDVLVGINLLREGLDLPEVSLILILDADKEGFLRNRRTLIQIIGRAARNLKGKVILYADKVTKSMAETMKEVDRRRKIQEYFNEKNRIVPKSIVKDIRDSIRLLPDEASFGGTESPEKGLISIASHKDIAQLEAEMHAAADNLDFERAAQIRDSIKALEKAK